MCITELVQYVIAWIITELVQYVIAWIINPLHMHKRVTVVCLFVCVSVNALTARVLISTVQPWYYHNWHVTSKVLDLWILLELLCLKVIVSFQGGSDMLTCKS